MCDCFTDLALETPIQVLPEDNTPQQAAWGWGAGLRASVSSHTFTVPAMCSAHSMESTRGPCLWKLHFNERNKQRWQYTIIFQAQIHTIEVKREAYAFIWQERIHFGRTTLRRWAGWGWPAERVTVKTLGRPWDGGYGWFHSGLQACKGGRWLKRVLNESGPWLRVVPGWQRLLMEEDHSLRMAHIAEGVLWLGRPTGLNRILTEVRGLEKEAPDRRSYSWLRELCHWGSPLMEETCDWEKPWMTG